MNDQSNQWVAAGALQHRSLGSPAIALALLVGLAALVIPTMLFVARESWGTEEGSHGPIVLFTGLWLVWRQWPEARARIAPPPAWAVATLMAMALVLYVFARVTQILELEGYFMYGCLVVLLYSAIGGQALRQLWFPLFYLAFMFPPPETIVAAITLPMKTYLSEAAIGFLGLFGYPIGGEGVHIYIGQYELLVAAACSGLNSIISLSALSLFYIYVRHKADWRYAAFLTLLIVPVALLANFVRVLILILLTYHAGEAAAQGFLHNFAGIVMFAVALLIIFAFDEAVRGLLARRATSQRNSTHA